MTAAAPPCSEQDIAHLVHTFYARVRQDMSRAPDALPTELPRG